MSEVQAVCVDPKVIGQVWPVVREMIRDAMVRGGGIEEFANVESDTLNGRRLLWLAWDGAVILAAAVTQVGTVDGVKAGTIDACGGSDLSRFAGLRIQLEQHFRDEGCAISRIHGRRGWLKHYPDYRVKSVLMQKVL